MVMKRSAKRIISPILMHLFFSVESIYFQLYTGGVFKHIQIFAPIIFAHLKLNIYVFTQVDIYIFIQITIHI